MAPKHSRSRLMRCGLQCSSCPCPGGRKETSKCLKLQRSRHAAACHPRVPTAQKLAPAAPDGHPSLARFGAWFSRYSPPETLVPHLCTGLVTEGRLPFGGPLCSPQSGGSRRSCLSLRKDALYGKIGKSLPRPLSSSKDGHLTRPKSSHR